MNSSRTPCWMPGLFEFVRRKTTQAICVMLSKQNNAPRAPESMTMTGIAAHNMPCVNVVTPDRKPEERDRNTRWKHFAAATRDTKYVPHGRFSAAKVERVSSTSHPVMRTNASTPDPSARLRKPTAISEMATAIRKPLVLCAGDSVHVQIQGATRAARGAVVWRIL